MGVNACANILGPVPNDVEDLGIIILASDSPSYIKEWLKTPSDHVVTIKRIKQAKPNVTIYYSFLVTGLSSNKDGKCKYEVSYVFKGPNGEIVFDETINTRAEEVLPVEPTFIMADPALDITLEDTDPTGIYVLESKVIDLVSNKKAMKTYEIKLVKR